MKFKKIISGLLAAAMAFSLAACGEKKEDTITIYDGNFSEMQLIHRMVKLLVEENTDLKVEIKDEMAPPNLFSELTSEGSDIMNSYDGTLLTTFLHLDASDVPDGTTLYDFANEKAMAEYGVRLLGKLGTNNTYVVAIPKEFADEHNIETVSDLVPYASELVFGAEHDFFTEEGSAKFDPMIAAYGLEFKEFKQIDQALKYQALGTGDISCTVIYATDGLQKEANLKQLKDDKAFFPEYNGAILVRDDLFERFKDVAPNLEETIRKLDGIFTDELMADLSYAVDVGVNGEKKTVDEVAKTFLQEQGLLS